MMDSWAKRSTAIRSRVKATVEIIVKNIRAYPRTCVGCQKSGRDVMISVAQNAMEIHDIFLTQEQADELSKELAQMKFMNNEKL